MREIIECVPNFSDGRHPEVYNAIANVIRDVPGISVLNVDPDEDHHRTVITFVGDRAAVEEAAFRAIKRASELINLDEHQGEHPRIGATDVVPFIPVRGVTMDECIEIARRLGQRVGEELGIAVYLYAEAATRPDRVKLSDIRKGEYEQWREEIGTYESRNPDFGPAVPRPCGATVIGARPFLIAYNLYLDSGDVSVAKRIARSVRASSGGLQNVQALGFLVDGQAQVSMNLLNFERTPIPLVQEMVRREAARYGRTITKAELIGMAPQRAFMNAATWYLQLDELQDAQVLEYRLAQTDESGESLASLVPHSFLEAVAGGTPTPGGGSVAALAGALGAALTEMIANLTVGRKKYAESSAAADEIRHEAAQLRRLLTKAVVEDSAAYEAVMTAYRNKEVPDEERKENIEAAMMHAGQVPLQVVHLARDVLELARRITEIGNENAVTDAAAGAIMARAAAEIAALNVKINGKSLKDRDQAKEWEQELGAVLDDVSRLSTATTRIAAERGGF